ncbi:MAG: 3,4-dihydroxy-2-butanone-4-phosphate synthase [Pseudomonadota bacterium]
MTETAAAEPPLSVRDHLSTIPEVLADAKAGKMFVLVDAEDRENEGDLVIPAQMATPEAINFMAKYGRGLVCLTLAGERARALNLQLMAQDNRSRHQTAFTVSIEAREGISTGISAHDRARTIAVAIDAQKSEQDIVSPGHVFPLVARDGGVLVRAGHTEAATDIARLAGLYPAGVICEIMNDDGTMARIPDLIPFAKSHGLKIATIADLIAYRRVHDKLIKRIETIPFRSDIGGDWTLHLFVNQVEYAEHVALVKGEISADEPALVRMHSVNTLQDLLAMEGGRSDLIRDAMRHIAGEGQGVIVLVQDKMTTKITDALFRKEKPPAEDDRLREYGVGAQILTDLGIERMVLLSNTEKSVVALDGYGLSIEGWRAFSKSGGAS